MYHRVLLTALLWSAATVADASERVARPGIRLYYVPIGSETYVPVTPDSIEPSAVRSGRVDERSAAELITTIEHAVPGTFDGVMVRVKLVLDDERVIYIDNQGGIRSGGKSAALPPGGLLYVKRLIEEGLESR